MTKFTRIFILGLVIVLFTTAGNLMSQVQIGSTTYTTLKSAFDAINSGLHTGSITITINDNTTETATAVLMASGNGSASYSDITIYPTGTYTISGNLSGALVELRGADNVTIDGRVDQSGSDRALTFQNNYNSSGHAVFWLDSAVSGVGKGASYNTIQYCNIVGGVGTTTSYGIVTSASSSMTANGAGCNYNKFLYNEISKVYYGIRSYGYSNSQNYATLGLEIKYNNFGNAANGIGYYAMYIYYTWGADISYNNFSYPLTTLYGIYSYYGTNMIISYNNFKDINMSTNTIYAIYNNYGVNSQVTYNTISNIQAGTMYGIYNYYSNGSTVSNNTITNLYCTSASSYTMYEIYNYYSYSSSISNNNIGNNTSGGTHYGIYNYYAGNCTINANLIYNLTSRYTSSHGVVGVYLYGSTSTGTTTGSEILLSNNVIYGLLGNYATTSISTTPYNTHGICIYGGINHKIYYNTVNLYGTLRVAGYSTAFATNYSYATGMDIRNNSFTNSMTGPTNTKAYAMYFYTTSQYSTINYNDYYVSGTYGILGYLSSDRTTIALWRAGTSQDGNSFSSNPLYNDYNNVRPQSSSPLRAAGTYLSTVTSDNLGVTRSTSTPTVGAYEQTGDFGGPVITYTALTATSSTSDRILSPVTMTDLSGIDVNSGTKPRIYYRKITNSNTYNDNTSSTDGWKWTEATNSSSPFSFTIEYSKLYGGATPGALIEYFVIAQDIQGTPWLGWEKATFTSDPTSVALSSANFPVTNTNYYQITAILNGTYTVGDGGTFPSLTGLGGAFSAVNSGSLNGSVVFEIVSDITETGLNALNQWVEQGGSGYTMTIRPNSAVVRNLTGSYSAQGLIRINNASRVTIDGRYGGTGNYLNIANNSSSSNTTGIHIGASSSTGGQYNTIRNCTVSTGTNSTTSYGIFCGSTSVGSSSSYIDNNNIIENVIKKAYYGLFYYGSYADNVTIRGNIIGSNTPGEEISYRGMYCYYLNNSTVSENTVFNMNYNTSKAGIAVYYNTNTVYSKNVVRDIYSAAGTSYQCMGFYVYLSSNANVTFSNNLIYNIINNSLSGISYGPQGFYLGGGSNIYFYHNSIILTGDRDALSTTMPASPSTCIYMSSSPSGLTFKNNLFYNNQTDAVNGNKSYLIYTTGTASQFTNCNNNNYYVEGAQGMPFYLTSADVTSLANWKIATGQESNSLSDEPRLNNVYYGNYRPAPNSTLVGAGASGTGVTDDFLGVTRSTTAPTIGAYEQGVDVAGPIINYIPLGNTGYGNNRTLVVSISDYSGIGTGANAPRLYYRQTRNANTVAGNTNLDNGWKWVNASSINGNLYTFVIDYSKLYGGSLNINEQLDYFVIAQDQMTTPNISYLSAKFASEPTSVDLQPANCPVSSYYSYLLLRGFSGTVYVGSGQTYNNLTLTNGLFDQMNKGILTGNLNIVITSNLTSEDGSVGLFQQMMEGGGPYTVTIKPSAGVPYTISGFSSTSLIRLEGADNVTIDGSYNNTGRYLTFTNTNAGSSSYFATIHIAASGGGAINNTIKNCKISTGYSNYSYYSFAIYVADVSLSTSGSGPNNDNLLIDNNEISKATFGIYVRGTSAGMLDNLRITNNRIGSDVAGNYVVYRGMDLQYATAPLISDNVVWNMILGTYVSNNSGIEIGGTFTDAMIARNKVYNIKNPYSGGYGAYGINFTGGTNCTLVNNMIWGISTMNYSSSSTTYNPFAIRMTSGTGYKLYNNTVYMFGQQGTSGSTASFTAGLFVNSTSVTGIDMRNNIFINSLAGVGATRSYPVYVYNTTLSSAISNSNYNLYYSSLTPAYLAGYGTSVPGTGITDIAGIQSGTGQDQNSIVTSVDFVSANDAHISGNSIHDPYLLVPQLPGVTDDIDKETRRATETHIGADEVNPILGFTKDLTFEPDLPVYCSNASTVDMSFTPTILGYEDGVVRSASPSFSIKWFKNGQEIIGALGTLLSFSNILQSDSADYQVQIDYVFSQTSTKLRNLKVETEMTVTTDPISTSLCSTDPSLTLSVKGTGTINNIQWQKEDKQNPGIFNDIPGQNSEQLIIPVVNAQQASGHYRAMLIGPGNCGPAQIPSATAIVDVSEPVTYTDINSPLDLSNVCYGVDIVINAVSDGTVVGYQWQYLEQGNWTDIPGQTNRTLIIRKATPAKSGYYRCFIYGNPYCDATPKLTPEISAYVWPLVEFTKQPQSKLLCRGDSASMLVMVDGIVLGFQWKKDGIPIDVGQNFSANSQLLYLFGNDYDNSGVYTCDVKVHDCLGIRNVESAPALIYVITGTTIISATDTVATKFGGTASLEVRAHANGAPPDYKVEVQWYRGTQMLTDNDRIGGTKSSILTIKEITPADLGNDYWVIVTALCNADTAYNYGFFIPSITVTEQPKDIVTCEKSAAVYSVKGNTDASRYGSYDIKYQWYRGSMKLIDDNRIKGSTSDKLTIMNVTNLDVSADYWCELSIMPGPVTVQSARASLVVNNYPLIVMQPDPIISLQNGKELMLYCSAIGTQPLNFQWYKDNIAITGGNDSIYKVTAATSGDAGKYHCVVSNLCGSVRSDESEVVITFKIFADVNENLYLSEVSSEPNPFNSSTTISFEMKENLNVKLVITDLYGHEVATLADKFMEAGRYNFIFDANTMNLSSGTYYYSIQTNKELVRGKLILVK